MSAYFSAVEQNSCKLLGGRNHELSSIESSIHNASLTEDAKNKNENNNKRKPSNSPKTNTCGMSRCQMNREQVCAFTVEGCFFSSLKTMTLQPTLLEVIYTQEYGREKCHCYTDLSRDCSHPPHSLAAGPSYLKIDHN